MAVNLGVLGSVEATESGTPLPVAGAKPRAVLTLLGLHTGEVVRADALLELLWGESPPRTAAKALQTHISTLRRALGDGVVITRGGGWTLSGLETDVTRYLAEARAGRAAAASGDATAAIPHFEAAISLWRGSPELPETPRGSAEMTRWAEDHAALVEDRADAFLATGRAADAVGALEAAVADAPLRERRWGQLVLALYRAGRQGEALRAYQRARTTLAEEIGVEPGPELQKLEAAVVAHDPSLDAPDTVKAQPTRAVTFLLTDIEGSTAAWETEPAAMAAALARHDALIDEIVASHGGHLVKTRGEGDATFSVFERPSAGAVAAAEVQRAVGEEPWPLEHPLRIRIALHTGEAEVRDGDYFGRAVNRAARLRSLARGGQTLLSRATADLVADSLPDGVHLVDLGPHQLRDLTRLEHVFELRLGDEAHDVPVPRARPRVPGVLAGGGPFVGREAELERLAAHWAASAGGAAGAMFIAGEPGVGKTRVAGEWARRAHDQGALVLYGRCDEDLGAPYQPFAEAMRALVPCVGAERLRTVRGVEDLARLVPELSAAVPGLPKPTQADPDTERYVLFDAIVRLLATASADTPVLLVLDDLHWAGKPTLLLLRHVLRFGEGARVQIVGTYRSTDLSRAHPLSGALADLQRDGTAERISLSGLPEEDVNAYLAASGYDDEHLGAALSEVTDGNPFFLIEVLHHVDETGGTWDANTLPQGVREAVDRRLSRLSERANDALLVGAIIGAGFSLELVEQVVEGDLVDAIDEARHAGIVIEEAGGRFRFNHALVRQSLLADVGSLKRTRLHRRVAEALEATTDPDDDTHLADLARHWFECALSGGAVKAVDYCRRAGEQAMARLAYEEAADFYDRALQAADDDAASVDGDARADLLIARCEALLAAGDVPSASAAVVQLEQATRGSARLAAWAACFAGQLAVLTRPEELDNIERAVAAAAEQLASHDDVAGEAKAHTVRAACLARLGRIADCETALDRALTAARRAGHHRRVNAVLAGAPVAALWGPNPVPRAGGRCLDVIRLLRITTGSLAVEATSIRCQAVLEAFRGRPPAARRMLETARRTLAELGLRHALLEVDLFAGIVELTADEAAAAEPHLRRAYDGFRTMGVDIDAAQAAALLARARLALGDDGEAEELCATSEKLGGHDLKASIAWRAVRAQLLAHRGDHAEARRLAEAAVALAERTDALVDHGDACLALATVLHAAGDAAGARTAAARAEALYERKGANALVERALAFAGDQQPKTPAAANAPASGPGSEFTNAATTRMFDALGDAFARRDWDAVREFVSTPYRVDDRRPVVGSAGKVLDVDMVRVWQSYAEVGATEIDVTVLATRGERLGLLHWAWRGQDYEDPCLVVGGVDGELKIDHGTYFGPDDVDAAYAELDAQYLAGEASQNAEVFETVAAGVRDLAILAEETADVRDSAMRIVEVHALDDRGLVCTILQHGESTDGSAIEMIFNSIVLVDGGHVTRIENFEENALDTALSRFEELRPGARAVENAATIRMVDAFVDAFARRDWDGIRDFVSAAYQVDDRRPVVGSAGRVLDADVVKIFQSIAEVGAAEIDVTVLATRGDRLALLRWAWRGQDYEDVSLVVGSTDGEMKLDRTTHFGPDDLDAAYAELDAQYRAGEAAPYADAWNLLVERVAALNRHEVRTVPGFVTADHRPASVWDLVPDLEVVFEQVPDVEFRVISVHRLDHHGVVATLDFGGTSRDGLDARWIVTNVYGVVNGEINRLELFPDDELDAALARFEELRPGADVALENANTRLMDRFVEAFNRASWDEMEAETADDFTSEDRRQHRLGRPLVGRRGVMDGMRSASEHAGLTHIEQSVLAVRGDKLSLVRWILRGNDDEPGAPQWEYLHLGGEGADGLERFSVLFDVDDLDAAYEELEARYLAGEASHHAAVWQVVIDNFAGLNRRDFEPVSPDFATVDHRQASLAPDELTAYIQATWEAIPDVRFQVIGVHSLDGHGAVFRIAYDGTSVDGVEAHWTMVPLWIVRDGAVARIELFPDDKLDAALARFEELRPGAVILILENAATRAQKRKATLFFRRDWDALGELYGEDSSHEDRRPGMRSSSHGRTEMLRVLRGVADVGVEVMDLAVIATRGERLALLRIRWTSGDEQPSAFYTETLQVLEVDHEDRFAANIVFEPDDLDSGFKELEARYLAAEGATHAATWRLLVDNYRALNRHEFGPTTPDFAYVDHRLASLAPGQITDDARAMFELVPDMRLWITAVHALDSHGAVMSSAVEGTSTDGVEAQWVRLNLFTVRDGLIARLEDYPENELDAALARFEELRPTPTR